MIGHRLKSLFALFALAVLMVTGMVLSGCSSGVSEAQIPSAKLIETFRIRDDSFAIQANVVPAIDISNGATRYTMRSQAFLTFILLNGDSRIFFLTADDIVIERPESGLLTVVQNRATF
jgi:hypothetical protein